MTSHDVIAIMRKITRQRRIGHAGTLDPMATGVLPVLIGKATAVQDIIMDHDKKYRAGMRFGIATDTGDITGNVISQSNDLPTYQMVVKCAKSFVGDYLQIPPMYSAIKVGGKKLYQLARQGKSVEREGRNVSIYEISPVSQISDTDFIFDVSCSKGTYIRTLCEDIGNKLGCPATLFSLERTLCGIYTSDSAIRLSQLTVENVESFVTPVENLFSALAKITLSPFYSKLAKNGAEIYLDRAKICESVFQNGKRCRMYDNNGVFFALGELEDFPDGKAVKAKIRFD